MVMTVMPADWKKYKTELPSGYRVITNKEALADVNILARAREFINRNVKNKAPLGTTEYYDIGTGRYAFVVEPHYHTPNGPTKPWGWHKGCTVYVGPTLMATVPGPTRDPVAIAKAISKKSTITG